MDVEVAKETPDQPAILALLREADAYYAGLYPAEHNYLLDVSSLSGPEVAFLVARRAGRPLGYGALVARGDGWSEIKRMYVRPQARGLGLGRILLDALLTLARRQGDRVVRLETGTLQPEAIGLYRRAGFVEIPAFEPYPPAPVSLFMELTLDSATPGG